jgi:hypothetical protein
MQDVLPSMMELENLYEAANEFREIEPWRVIDDTDWQIISIVRNHRGRNGSVTSIERIGV